MLSVVTYEGSNVTRSPYHAKDGITLYHGDNCEVMLELPPASVDLVVTSPPYDDLRTYGGHSWDFYGVAWNLKRLLKPGGVIVWVVNDKTEDGSETGTSSEQAKHFRRLGLRQHDTMIYFKNGMSFPETNRYYPVWEYMFVFSLGAPATANLIADRQTSCGGDKKTSRMERQPDGSIRRPNREFEVADSSVRYNIWTIDAGFMKTTKDTLAYDHPAIFPEALARDHIVSWSNEGDTVLDPFSGSGTTIKMARECGRLGIGIEINQEYCDIAVERLRQRLLFGAAGRK